MVPLITHNELLKILRYEPETGHFWWINPRHKKHLSHPAGCIKYNRKDKTYKIIAINIKSKAYRGSRLAWFYVYKKWPVLEIDHINGETIDNRLVNLRELTRKQNSRNKIPLVSNNTSGFNGVSWNEKHKKWRSDITYNGRKYYLGHFDDLENAKKARLEGEKKYWPQDGCEVRR